MRKEATEGDILRNAAFASLDGRALTPEAKKLVAEINSRVVACVSLEESKPGRVKTNRKKLKAATEAFVADLLTAQSGKLPRRWVYRAMAARGFTGAVGYRVFKPLMEALRALGLIEHRPGAAQWVQGFNQELAPGPKTTVANRWAARFCATPELLSISKRLHVLPSEADQHFDYGLPQHPLQKRKASKRDAYGKKVHGPLMKFTHTVASSRLEEDVRELNAFLNDQDINGGIHRGYVRIFNNGDDPSFDWNFGGRLYSQPSGTQNYQQLKSSQRRKMTINGEPVAEVDIRASFLTIFHAWHGVQLDPEKDPYEMQNLGKATRDVVKLWMVATFGAGKPLVRWPSELVKDYNNDHPRSPLDRKRYTVSRVRESLVARYPLLARWGEPIAGRARTWADLQYDESVVIISTMLRLMQEHEVPSLAVHDSVIVPHSHSEMAAETLRETFKDTLGTNPLIKINPPIGAKGTS